MTQAIAYLGFDGTCADAARFYEQALGGTLKRMMTFGQSPMAEHVPEASHDRIVHACIELPGGGLLYAGDTPLGMPYDGIKGVSIAVDYATVAEAETVFAALSEGGTVTMPMNPSFWAASFGMCTDRFGTPWIVNGAPTPL